MSFYALSGANWPDMWRRRYGRLSTDGSARPEGADHGPRAPREQPAGCVLSIVMVNVAAAQQHARLMLVDQQRVQARQQLVRYRPGRGQGDH